MPRLEKFSENALKASSSQNRTLEGEGSVDEKAPERRGFWAGVDLRLGAIDATNVNRFRGRKREEQSEKSQANQIYQIYKKESTYAWKMHEYVTCKTKIITMFINLGPLAKGRLGVKRHSPQAVGRSQKANMSSSLDTVLKCSQLG